MPENFDIPLNDTAKFIEQRLEKVFEATTSQALLTHATSALEEIVDKVSDTVGTSLRKRHPGENQLLLQTPAQALLSARNSYGGYITNGGQVSADAARSYIIGHLLQRALLRLSDLGYGKQGQLSGTQMTSLIEIINTLFECSKRGAERITNETLRSQIMGEFQELKKRVSHNLRGSTAVH